MKRQQLTGLLTVGAIALLNLVTNANIADAQPKTPSSEPDWGFVCNQDNKKEKLNFPNIGSENDVEFLKGKIALLILTGDCQEAIKNLDKALKIDPKSEELWQMKGIVSLRLANYSEAFKSFDQVVTINPKNADSWFMKGTTAIFLGNFPDALASFNETINIKPDFAEAYVGRALPNYFAGNVKQAKSDLNQAIELYKKVKNKEGVERAEYILKTMPW